MKLTPAERETIILFDDAGSTANVYTHDHKLIEKLKHLHEKYPEQILGQFTRNYTQTTKRGLLTTNKG